MKCHEILNENDQPDTGHLSDSELTVVYNHLGQSQMSKEEIDQAADQIIDGIEYQRSKQSAIFALTRMHILVHGVAPEGETQNRADTMFQIPNKMIQFVVNQGDYDQDDLHAHIEHAKEELANRPVKKSRNKATEMMAKYYQQHKQMLPHTVKDYREQIIQDIMDGMSAEDAFEKYT